MTRKLLSTTLFLILSSVAWAQTPWWHCPDSVSLNKEPARGDVVCYASRDEAIAKEYHKSQYLQPLTEWTRTTADDGSTVYSTRYKLPFNWLERELFLHVAKASSSFDVEVNGRRVAYSQTGSTPSEFDLTRFSVEGNNDLRIILHKDAVAQQLENSRRPADVPVLGETYILAQPRVRVRDIFVETRTEGTSGLLYLGIILKSHQLNVKDYRVYYELISPQGETVSSGYKDATIDMRREDTVRFFDNIADIVPWSHEEPRLYTLFVKTQNEGRFREYLSFQIGFRSLGIEDGVITLNRVPLRVKMTEYESPGDMETARADIQRLREQGYTALKIKGAPQSSAFYNLCDEMGMYICNQADIDVHLSGNERKVGGTLSNNPEWEAAFIDRVTGMYHSSKNHPSVIMFSLAENSSNGYNLYESYLALKRLETSRPIVYPDGTEWNSDSLDIDKMASLRKTDTPNWALVTANNTGKGLFRVHNTRHYTPIIGDAVYRIAVGKRIVASGSVPVRVMPKSAADIAIPITGVKEGREFSLQIEIVIDKPVNKYTLPTTETEPANHPFAKKKMQHGDNKTAIERRTFIGRWYAPRTPSPILESDPATPPLPAGATEP